MTDISQSLFYIAMAMVFVAAVIAFEGLYLWWNGTRGPEARRIEQRLRIFTANTRPVDQDTTILKQRQLARWPALQRWLMSVPQIRRLDRLIEQAGLDWSVAKLLLLMTGMGFGAFLLMILVSHAWLNALMAAIASGWLPIVYVKRARRQRLQAIELQLPSALDLIARALRVGHSFQSALGMVADQMTDPIAGEFAVTYDEINFGIPVQNALNNLAARVQVGDLRYFVVAALIQHETGGNLAELLDGISSIVRERRRLQGTIRTLSAEGRISAWILCVLPFVMGFALYVLNPQFVSQLWLNSGGIKILTAFAVLMTVGIMWTRALCRFRV